MRDRCVICGRENPLPIYFYPDGIIQQCIEAYGQANLLENPNICLVCATRAGNEAEESEK